MSVLVNGGAGYIGSHMAYALLDRGEQVAIVDNLSTGVRGLVPEAAFFVSGNVGDENLIRDVIRNRGITAVIHFAGSIVVPESVADPLLYYRNNTIASHTLISACVAEKVQNFIFSSTAAVYGTASVPLINEAVVQAPINPYGRSKLMTEWMLEDTARAHDCRYIALRYFNVSGADPKGRTGQSTPRATHLIKRACQAALGRIDALEIFGTDFETPDGTGVRDYIHVSDLVTAHLLALDALRAGAGSDVFNAGYGRGLSVREIVAAIEKVTGKQVPTKNKPRRPGDPAMVVADSTKLREVLGWKPAFDDVLEIVRSAYEWERRFNHAPS
jgi:UDP-glucose 4-epimerase